MSTYYFMVCDDHKESTDAVSRTAGGYCPLGDSAMTLRPFIVAHAKCRVRILNEHQYEDVSEVYDEWAAAQIASRVAAAEADGRWQ